MERFIIEHNVRAFIERLQIEPDFDTRATLKNLLIAEADRFGRRAERLEFVDHWIGECQSRVARLRAVLAEIESDAAHSALAERTLKNLTELAVHLETHRQWLMQQMDDDDP